MTNSLRRIGLLRSRMRLTQSADARRGFLGYPISIASYTTSLDRLYLHGLVTHCRESTHFPFLSCAVSCFGSCSHSITVPPDPAPSAGSLIPVSSYTVSPSVRFPPTFLPPERCRLYLSYSSVFCDPAPPGSPTPRPPWWSTLRSFSSMTSEIAFFLPMPG